LSISNNNNQNNDSSHISKQTRLIEKQLNDLEELQAKICQLHQNNVIKDDCYELQKFCAKLEYLLQLNLKEKKNSSSSPSVNTSNKEYWSYFVDVLAGGRGFQDAIKYVKSLSEVKSNLGRGRAFIRFCLQYHRLADAIQQLTMDDKIIIQWYFEKCIWISQSYKSRIINTLYEINEVNFELISKNNYELDTTWPVVQSSGNVLNVNNSSLARNRTYSMTSFVSINTDQKDHVNQVNI
jgi:hypothetical protein